MQDRAEKIIMLVLIAALIFSAYRARSAMDIEAAVRGEANVNAESGRGETSLINAAVRNPNMNVIKALVQAGADGKRLENGEKCRAE